MKKDPMNYVTIEDTVAQRPVRVRVYPEFQVHESDELLIRGGKFYAVWDPNRQIWSRETQTIQQLIDTAIDNKIAEIRAKEKYPGFKIVPEYIHNYSTGHWTRFLNYTASLSDSSHRLDENLTFRSQPVKLDDYVSKRLSYDLCDGDISAYEELISTLYAPEERAKIEWAIGSILAGDSKRIQKFIVFHGPMGTGKSTVMNLIEKLFGGYGKDGYCAKINAKALVGSNVGFALEPFAKNPLVGIDQDSNLSRIEDNTILNQIVSHDTIQINEKFKNLYETSAKCFLFMGTNEPVKITNSKSGVIRRLIDVEPTGKVISPESKYDHLVECMNQELGAIAKHCLDVYKSMGRTYYSKYVPKRMMLRTDPFFNFMYDNSDKFEMMDKDPNAYINGDFIWNNYKTWCDSSGMEFKLKRYQVLDEAKSYFDKFEERKTFFDPKRPQSEGQRVRNVYSGFKKTKFDQVDLKKESEKVKATVVDYPDEGPGISYPSWLEMKQQHSILDDLLADCVAQYGNEKPKLFWKDVTTKLKDLDTSKPHFVQTQPNLICIDLDKKDAEGKKDFVLNAEAVKRLNFPQTYAERSRGGQGIHLSYWYDGDPSLLTTLIEEDVEVKIQVGNAALRRRLSLCNNLPIAHIPVDMLPLRKKKMVNKDVIENEQHLKYLIGKALRKEIEPHATKTSMDFIKHILEEAQEQGISYDLKQSDTDIFNFAAASTHNADYCLKIYADLKLRWPEPTAPNIVDIGEDKMAVVSKFKEEAPIVFFDVEVFKNGNLIVYKEIGEDKKCNWLLKPKSWEIEPLLNMRLVGFNNRGYDNYIIWAIYLGWEPEKVYELSQEIIVGGNRNPFRDAANLSYTDIYDYASEKKSLKKWELALGIPHVELDWPWDKELPEDMWEVAAKYCENDVRATEAVWNATQADFKAREILAEIAGMTVNNTTNQLTTRIIFGKNRNPQNQFNCPDLAKEFPGYRFEHGKSYFGDEVIGEGGRVYANPGMYRNVKTFDVASMHPSSIIAENGFGPYTQKFKDLMDIRIAIKHKDFETAKKMMDGKLAPYLDDPAQAKQLSFALKIAINSVYGLTAAKFDNPFHDPRNKDNWVAKRGALFMETLRLKVQEMGASVVHIKTDSIKVADPTAEIENFILSYGKQWGYNFEVESIYDRICLVNDAVYIAKCTNDPENGDEAGHWTATGAQFQHEYVFKALFSKEPITFKDRCETRTVTTAMYLDMNEQKPDISKFEKELEKCEKALKKDEGNQELISRIDQLKQEIAKGHDYHFIGKAGLFCPILPGYGGGELVRLSTNGSYGAIAGTKGYRWLEAEEVTRLQYESHIDESYFKSLVDTAIDTINEFGSFDIFVSGADFANGQFKKNIAMAVSKQRDILTIKPEDLPWYTTPCNSDVYAMCCDCPQYYDEQEYCRKLGYNIKNKIIID